MLRLLDRGLTWVCVAAAVLVVVLLFAGPSLVGAKKTTAGGASNYPGAQVFTSAGCGSCHTLKAAGTTGTVGPDLDKLRPSADVVSQIVRSGGGGMPGFEGRLSSADIDAVATYVARVAGP
jgi:mono/diheme cytochrome c family protein